MSAVRKAVKALVNTSTVVHMPIKSVHADPNQPRKVFDDAALEALSANIAERGILQPILVRQEGDRTVIVDGERRWRAAKLAKLEVVPTLRVDMGTFEDDQIRLDQVSVNQLREQLRPMDLARVLRDMRNRGKTTNDIAAMLDKQGHGALKPAQIDAMAKLIDLPEWAQSMIDAEEIEPAGAVKILDVLDIKGIAAPLKKRLVQAAGYTGSIQTNNVGHEISRVLDELLVDLNKTDSWNRDPVHFAFKTRCKGCEHFRPFGTRGYCTNAKLFKVHNQEAKDAGLLPGGKRPEKPKPVAAKVAEKQAKQKLEQRERSLGDKARDYLHTYLARKLQGRITEQPGLQSVLAIWAALKKPGTIHTRGAPGVFYGGEPYASAAQSQGVHSLEVLLTGDTAKSVEALQAAAQEIVCDLPWRETHAFARHCWPALDAVWSLDADFLDLFRKDELVHIAVKHECNPGDGKLWDRLKNGDIKAALLTQPERLSRPAILVDLYEGEIDEPYNPRGWEDRDDEDDSDDDGGFGDDDE
jgi:ParB/RepB/Spo0J family partition protein